MTDGQRSPTSDGQIVVSGLTKQYKNVRAVDNLSFTVGAGAGDRLPRPERRRQDHHAAHAAQPGHADRRHGHHQRPAVRRPRPTRCGTVGAVLEASSAHKGRTGINHLRVICAAAGLPEQRADEALALVGLTPAAKRKFKGYSLGMKQRLGIAAAMLGDPRVLILDEPANGLDPEGIRWMRGFLKGLADEGRTVLVSSHLLSEMQLLADDVVIIAAGKLVRQGPVDQVLGSMAQGARVRVRTPQAEELTAALQRAVGDRRDRRARRAAGRRRGRPDRRPGRPGRRGRAARADHRTARPGTGLPGADGRKGGHPMNLVRSELLKIRTTNTWWIFGARSRLLALGAGRSLINWLQTDSCSATGDGRRRAAPEQADAASGPRPSRGRRRRAEPLHLRAVLRAAVRDAARHPGGDQRVLPPDRHHHVPHHAAPHRGDRRQAGRRRRCSALLFWLVTTVLDLIAGGADHCQRQRAGHPARRLARCWRAIAAQPAGVRCSGRSSGSASAC